MRKAAACISGILFGAAWFIWIDGHVYENSRNNDDPDFKGPGIQWVYYLPGVFATLALVMSNIVKLDSLYSSSFLSEETTSKKIKIWLFISFAINFGCIAGAIWIMAAVFMPPHNTNSAAQWPGIALTLQNLLIFFRYL
eukprot:gene9303-11404_t